MKRDLNKLAENSFDLLIIGGGINGACAAWDASLRGLSVAVVDKGDFCGATSANSLKIIHGGLRYLQQANIRRIRESIRERSILIRIAPHLVHPISFIAPSYGHGIHRKELLGLALKINDLIGFDRNRLNGSQTTIPPGRIVSREECLKIFPGFLKPGLTGGAIWYDCQVYNSERLTLSFLFSAAQAGAVIANYLEVKSLLTQGQHVCGARAVDSLNDNEIVIRARMVVNAAGPWVNEVTKRLKGIKPPPIGQPNLALAFNLVSSKTIGEMGICFQSETTREKDPICSGKRFLFLVPWRQYTLIGTSYKSFYGHPDDCEVREEDLQNLVDECNEACPGLRLSLADVCHHHFGLLPLKNWRKPRQAASLARNYRIIDHAIEDGISGLISVIGVKYTTARAVAQKTIDLVFKKLGSISPPDCKTSQMPIYGGDSVPCMFSSNRVNATFPQCLSSDAIKRLVRNYGSGAREVAKQATLNPEWGDPVAKGSSVLRCEVLHAVRKEMAVKLADVVFRRTELGTGACPPKRSLECVVQIMAEELDWDRSRQTKEVDEVLASYAPVETANCSQWNV